jgi:hypothetical protein
VRARGSLGCFWVEEERVDLREVEQKSRGRFLKLVVARRRSRSRPYQAASYRSSWDSQCNIEGGCEKGCMASSRQPGQRCTVQQQNRP